MEAMDRLAEVVARTEQEPTFPPGPLQDLLFDLWDLSRDTPAQQVVERWLTLTVERNLFSADEVRGALVEIRDLLAVPSAH